MNLNILKSVKVAKKLCHYVLKVLMEVTKIAWKFAKVHVVRLQNNVQKKNRVSVHSITGINIILCQ